MKRNYGWKKQKEDSRDQKFTAVKPISNLPLSVDLRNSMPNPYDQGELGSCTANAISGAIQFDLLKKNIDLMPSRLFIYYNERLVEGTVSEDSGAEIRDGIKSINNQGVCSELEWTYDISKFKVKPSEKCYLDAKLHKSLSYESVLQDETHIKSVLAEGYPVVFGFNVKSSFESEKVAKTGIYSPKKNEQIEGGHAVLVIGYINKTFIVRNSWGSNWGQKGYFTIPISEVTNKEISSDFWVIKTIM